MKAVILAAGYGTRLQRDVQRDPSGCFSHLSGVPKALLPVGGAPLLTHWIRALTYCACVDELLLVTNDLFHDKFQEWAQEFPNVTVLNDGTRDNEGRLGAVSCLQLAIKHFNVDDHILVIGGDTLFKEDFSLSKCVAKFFGLQAVCDDVSLVLSYECKEEETSSYGILEVNADLRVCCMKEKPLPTDTSSRRACPCFYIFSKMVLPFLDAFLAEKKNAPLREKDAPGNFLSWLIERKPVFAYEVSGRFDVGNLPSYTECDAYLKENLCHITSYLQ